MALRLTVPSREAARLGTSNGFVQQLAWRAAWKIKFQVSVLSQGDASDRSTPASPTRKRIAARAAIPAAQANTSE